MDTLREGTEPALQALHPWDGVCPCAGPGRKHRGRGPAMPPLDSLVPPAPPPEEEVQAEEVVQEEVEVEEPAQARRRQLLKILVPEDGEQAISDDESGAAPDSAPPWLRSRSLRLQLCACPSSVSLAE